MLTLAYDLLNTSLHASDEMNEMIDASFLSEEAMAKYKECIYDRARALEIS